MESYILDGLKPLKRYLSMNLVPSDGEANEDDGDGNIMDWGIDPDNDMHPNSLSSLTLINEFTNSTFDLHRGDHEDDEDDMDGLTPFNDGKFHDWGISPTKQRNKKVVKKCANDVFQELVMILGEQRLKSLSFLDEFRYTLVSSQLLDETILVSKFNQAKKSSMNLNKKNGRHFKKLGKIINSKSHFQASMSLSKDLSTLLKIRNLLQKIHQHQQKYSIQQIRLVLITLLIHLNFIIRSRVIINQILEQRFINQLQKFIKSFQKFDILIHKLITKYKEVIIYKNIIPSASALNENPKQIHDLITSSLTIQNNSVTNSFIKILPFTNGIELENYCGIYNIELIELASEIEEMKPFNNFIDEDPLDSIVSKFRKFQLLRRFLIVVVLATLNQVAIITPFLNNVSEIFQIQREMDCFNWEKLNTILGNIDDLTSLCLNLNKSIQQSITLKNSKDTTIYPTSNDKTDLLFSKIKEFELQLLLTRRSSNPNLLIELAPILENITSLYKKEITTTQNINKHTLKVDKHRKRFSLPNNSNLQYLPPQRSVSTSSKNYKRLSTGLTLPLLTVMEEEEYNPRAVSYDDNYLNIMPTYSTPVRHQQQEPEGQQNYIEERNLLSNDDSVIITTDQNEGEDEETGFDNIDFKEKLEMNFNKMIQSKKSPKTSDDDEVEERYHLAGGEINFNNNKIEMAESQSLMSELNAVLKK